MAGAVMKVSLMNAWTDGLRGAFAATMMQELRQEGWHGVEETSTSGTGT